MMAGFEKTLQRVRPGDALIGDGIRPPAGHSARNRHSSGPSTTRLKSTFGTNVFGNGGARAGDKHVKPFQLTTESCSAAETDNGHSNSIFDRPTVCSDDKTGRTTGVEEVGVRDEILIENFTGAENRRVFEQRIRRCRRPELKSFMFRYMPPGKVEVILRHDCGLDVSTVDVEELKKELHVIPQINVELLALAAECRFDQSADVTAVPGDDVVGKCACSKNSLKSKITLFLVDIRTGVKYLISTGHKRSGGDELRYGSIVKFASVASANFLMNCGVPTVDVALASLVANPGVSVTNEVIIGDRLVALSQRVESSENPVNKRVQKFCEESDGKTGIVRSLLTTCDGSYIDCLEVVSVDDGNAIHREGDSGTLLILELPESDQAAAAAAAGATVEARGFGMLIGLYTLPLTNGTSMVSSIAAPLDRTMKHVTSNEEFSWLQILKADDDDRPTAVKAVYNNVEHNRGSQQLQQQSPGWTDRFKRMQLIEREHTQSLVNQMADDLQTQYQSLMFGLKREVCKLRTSNIKQRRENQRLRRETTNKDRAILEMVQQLCSDSQKSLSQQQNLEKRLEDSTELSAELIRRLDNKQELPVHLVHRLGIAEKEKGRPTVGSGSCLLSDAELCTHQPALQTTETLHTMVVDGSQPRANVTSSRVSEPKIVNDVIHGNIELHLLLVAIIDTAQFQRLRNIKQWPGAYFVFSGAAHNRFEHSIGVAYLAGKVVTRLRKRQPELCINQNDVLCVQIAALCQDLGIGPLSHVYGKHFTGKDFKHEDMSLKMFEYMMEANNLERTCTDYGLTEYDMIFIREQIRGVQLSEATHHCRGRDVNKEFLYQIVGDRQSGLDVDAWDCYLRDSYHLQIKTAFDHKRLIKFMRVSTVADTGKRTICIRDKEVDSLYSEYATRMMHYRNAFQHKVAVAVETMLVDAMKLADAYIVVKGSDGQKLTLSTAFQDVVAFSKLDDSIYLRILHSRRPELAKAREILRNIEVRQLYQLVEECKPTIGADARSSLADVITERLTEDLKEDVAVAQMSSYDYGKARGQNPVDDIHCFTKECAANALPSSRQDFLMRPTRCREYIIRIYCKRRDEEFVGKVRESFGRIQKELGMSRSTQQP